MEEMEPRRPQPTPTAFLLIVHRLKPQVGLTPTSTAWDGMLPTIPTVIPVAPSLQWEIASASSNYL